jgi:hypothetical protein
MLRKLFAKIDDWLNPIVVRELRQAVQSRLIATIVVIYLGLQVLLLTIVLVDQSARGGVGSRAGSGIDLHGGVELFQQFQALLLGTCLLCIPAYAGIRLAGERSDQNVDLLYISTLKSRAIIGGKFLASVVLVLLIYSTCAPFMTFTYLLRGIDIPTIVVVLFIDFVVIVFGVQLAILLGTFPVPVVLKFILSLAVFGILVRMFFWTLLVTNHLIEGGFPYPAASWEFLSGLGAVTLAILSLVGLWFAWSVALVSPPSANRSMPVRLYMFVSWLLTGVLAAYWSEKLHEPEFLYMWFVYHCIVLALHLFTVVNERERWAPRVARTIPKSWLLRVPCFLFYTGSAGGLLFGLLLGGLSFLAVLVWEGAFPGSLRADETRLLEAMAVLLMYIFCYGITAITVRRLFMQGQVKVGQTWIVSLCLVGLGSTLPWIVSCIIYFDSNSYRHDWFPWWYLGNPFASMMEVGSFWGAGNMDYLEISLYFLGVWAALITLGNVGWFFRQFRAFRRFETNGEEALAAQPAADVRPAVEPA